MTSETMERERLDVTMVKRGLADSRERAKQLIEAAPMPGLSPCTPMNENIAASRMAFD